MGNCQVEHVGCLGPSLMQAHAPQACIHGYSQQARVAPAPSGREQWCGTPAGFRPSPTEQHTPHYCMDGLYPKDVLHPSISTAWKHKQAAHAVTLLRACKCTWMHASLNIHVDESYSAKQIILLCSVESYLAIHSACRLAEQ